MSVVSINRSGEHQVSLLDLLSKCTGKESFVCLCVYMSGANNSGYMIQISCRRIINVATILHEQRMEPRSSLVVTTPWSLASYGVGSGAFPVNAPQYRQL